MLNLGGPAAMTQTFAAALTLLLGVTAVGAAVLSVLGHPIGLGHSRSEPWLLLILGCCLLVLGRLLLGPPEW